ncbi:hypothetical protein PRNP1_014940 [Phytophthora ramorum]
MRLHLILLLATVALVSTVDASLAATSMLSSPAAARTPSVEQRDIVAKRSLRAETTTDEEDDDNEERVFSLPVTGTEKLSSLIKTRAKNTELESKLTDRFFKVLKLDTKNGFLFGNEKLREWGRYVLTLNKYDSEASITAMLSTLTKNYKPTDLARWIESAKAAPSVGNLATKLQEAQFTKWLAGGKDAIGIRAMLKKASTGQARNPLIAQRDEQIVQAFQKFAKQQKGIIV